MPAEVVDVFDQIESELAKANSRAEEVQDVQNDIENAKLGGADVPEGQVALPDFIQQINADYQANAAHVFILHGNTTDYVDVNGGSRTKLPVLLPAVFDTTWVAERMRAQAEARGERSQTPIQRGMSQVFCYYTLNNGLSFPCQASREAWAAFMRRYLSEQAAPEPLINVILNPGTDLMEVMRTLNYTFEASKATVLRNKTNRQKVPEIRFVVAFFNGEFAFPAGPILHLGSDKNPIAYLFNWAQDDAIADRNRILIITRSLEDIHESIRSGDLCVSSVPMKRPTLNQREQWLNNFETRLKDLPEDKRPFVGKKRRSGFDFAQDLDKHVMAVQAAGLNLRQMETVIMESWRSNLPIDFPMIMTRKQRVVSEEYGGLIEFEEPTFGFDHIGGHDNIKEYAGRKIIEPLRRGDRRLCSAGVIMTGPPGTGKTFLAKALAYESKMNFLVGNLAKAFDGIVGGTEKKIANMIDAVRAAAPCIWFLDEIDSVLSSGRSSPGDSGTAARVFNSVMQFASDPSRIGNVVILAASNRPDLLDAALIRAGRFDAIIPALPPAAGDGKGRAAILKALTIKHKVRFDKDSLGKTSTNRTSGLGRLLKDERIWTGAEIEVVLKDAMDNAFFAGHSVITEDDWNLAMDSVIPSTREVELQIDLALLYVNNLRYCPKDWLERAKNKGDLQSSIRTTLAEGGYDRAA